MSRTAEGQTDVTVRQMSQLEEVLGSHGRSGEQFEAWEAVYGPVGVDGYPKPLWDKTTGKIDPTVAAYMREHGYDLKDYLQNNWQTIGPKLAGKLHHLLRRHGQFLSEPGGLPAGRFPQAHQQSSIWWIV